ncbi:hypothetical protein CPCC7001_1183 [Cyanobium sp. PCC 7001]|uniref:hypothetical protein n=1 Tax=Cyanobium sp. PCC 7001 TaxID=180281 RepID=UPI000180514E|nr:hypothetical protein [Cyanobium sp. PCC 7001]EDY38304.1 hypothetical protein CPCC7001_1183 [Cyanobium sp. PCC 7001]
MSITPSFRSNRQHHFQGSGRGRTLAYPSCPLPGGGRQGSAQATPAQPLTWEELLGQR